MSKVAMESSSRINTTGSKYTVATGTGAVPSTSTSKRSRKAALGGDEFMAAAIGDTAWLRQTLKEGKNPANFDKNGLSAIHLAALHGRMECLKLLVEKYHVSVNLASSTGWRPIHLCINSRTGKRALECLQYLLDAGADPSAPNEDLMTPTHQAAIEGSVKCMAALLAGGGDISTPDCNGHLPLDYAKIWGHRKCARILASETWKREKEAELTKVTELQQLKNLKDAVDGWEEQDQQAYKNIQSEASFSEWMDKKGISDKQSPRLVSHKKESATLGAMANQLYQANSPRKANVPSVKLQAVTEKTTGKGKAAGSKGKTQTKSAAAPAKSPGAERVAPRERLCKGKTKPKLEPVPKVKVPILQITGEQNEDKVNLYMQPVPDLSQEVIDRILLEKLSPHERPLSFKCKNIIDAQHRRLYDSSVKPLEEVYAHLSNDKSSTLFPGVSNGGSSAASTRTSSTSSKDSFDNQRIADALKHIAKPYKFPQMQGEDFTYGFEVL
ncbi:ankyrin repeat domain-containing protein 53 [Strongylocentrotus purpuratus]|uniref:Ankyrin repeat domain-containing protein 53 n=1 Tax=Strongylocentrotus purpuratus TaxID=7668 RepID=A0A7M7LNZ3_STRPU|nr:ankyrin repeat domain-containing protein 53 [Strongylocentrotus purpuratus]